MEREEIKTLISEMALQKDEVEKLIEERIDQAIEDRKKIVSRQFLLWGGAISTVFSFLLIIGFSTEDIAKRIRNTLLPKSHMVSQLVGSDEHSNLLKNSIISELDDPDLKNYPKTKNTIQENVWKALETKDETKLKQFVDSTKLDEVIIDSYYEQVIEVLFSDKPSANKDQKYHILELGSVAQEINVGEFENRSNTKTNCGYDFAQDEKRVIIHIPAPEKGIKRDRIPLPWFQCPRGYHAMDVSLKVEDKVVSDIKVVGVERPTATPKKPIKGVRARVTNAVAEEFRQKGVDLGVGIVPGSITVTRVYDDL
ncbi:hypothetical protein [Vibrio panuliri]|uniref:Uncharacterized protein n=1 Tax=Vibrio panuliri TaxID=1381081 RepID=A0ABX3F5M6_9VIBR|nr:hypothetical protein [Vibrio panuliri]KAB1454307.1 hypothetical protein F7O85_15595 [Vibrio panuliri]OLQ85247.1 hypothetical protein BIY20_16140 [Vibrio panuliri]